MNNVPVPDPHPSSSPAHPSYEDRSTGLIVFGIIQIILGALAALMVPFMLLALALARKTTGISAPFGTLVLGALTYGTMAALLVTLGIGSIQARRWAHALTLVLSWIWLISGFLITIFITAFLPAGFAQGVRQAAAMNPNAPPMPARAMAIILTVMIVFFAVFLIVLPLAFVLFYNTRSVEETCKHKDPVKRWTDRCPLPVLAATLVFAGASAYYLGMSFTTPVIPFFGKYLSGLPGAAACLTMALMDMLLAYSFFRLYLAGWWLALATVTARIISFIVTLRHANMSEMYSRMGWNSSQLQMMNANPAYRSGVVLYSSVGTLVIFLGYLVWIRRYFLQPNQNPDASSKDPSLLPGT